MPLTLDDFRATLAQIDDRELLLAMRDVLHDRIQTLPKPRTGTRVKALNDLHPGDRVRIKSATYGKNGWLTGTVERTLRTRVRVIPDHEFRARPKRDPIEYLDCPVACVYWDDEGGVLPLFRVVRAVGPSLLPPPTP